MLKWAYWESMASAIACHQCSHCSGPIGNPWPQLLLATSAATAILKWAYWQSMALAVASARVATFNTLLSVPSSRDPYMQLRSPVTSNPLASTVLMASALMGLRWYPGWVERCCSETPLVRDTLAPSYSNFATREAGAVATEAERKKRA